MYGHSKAAWLIRSFIVFIFCAGLVGFAASFGYAQSLPLFNK